MSILTSIMGIYQRTPIARRNHRYGKVNAQQHEMKPWATAPLSRPLDNAVPEVPEAPIVEAKENPTNGS